jgi:hypothetical protein
MAIEIAARWDRMTMQDVAAQFSAQCLGSRGNVGYLSETYFGGPYPTEMLAPEALRYGRARIAAAELERRLPDALYEIETRELGFSYTAQGEQNARRLQKEYREFVALCAHKEEETGIPCLIVTNL